MRPTERQLASALKKYNEIMCILGYEHVTIGEDWSEDTQNWNLRDMVAECDYILSTYYEDGHCNYDLKREDRKIWISHTGRLKRFIAHWEPYIDEMVCVCEHCSKYDNFKRFPKGFFLKERPIAKGESEDSGVYDRFAT